jgi:protein TonB
VVHRVEEFVSHFASIRIMGLDGVTGGGDVFDPYRPLFGGGGGRAWQPLHRRRVPLDAGGRPTVISGSRDRSDPSAADGSTAGSASPQNNPACSPNPLPVGPSANNRPHLYNGPYKISAPARIVYVRPEYPQIARAAKVQGVVVLEAQIERDGHVCSARVLRSIPLLDQSAIDAVLRWRFTPAKTNVPVVMTLTVNFTLP